MAEAIELYLDHLSIKLNNLLLINAHVMLGQTVSFKKSLSEDIGRW